MERYLFDCSKFRVGRQVFLAGAGVDEAGVLKPDLDSHSDDMTRQTEYTQSWQIKMKFIQILN